MDVHRAKELLDRYRSGEDKTSLSVEYGFENVFKLIAFKRQQVDRILLKDYALKDDEILKPCQSVPFYASNYGHIFNAYQQRIMSRICDRYKTVTISAKTFLVHRLVCEAFYGESDLTVNHKDGDRFNNALENLEYCTPQENTRHSIDTLGNTVHGAFNGNAVLTDELAREIYLSYVPRSSDGDLMALSQKYGVDYTTVHLIVKKKIWVHATHDLPAIDTTKGKLSDEAVMDIRQNYVKRGKQNLLYFCRKYGVSKPTVRKALK